jgi:hypothetical protein
MIRTIEVLFVIIIIAGAFIATSYFTVLPPPRQVSPINLKRLSFTTLQMLDSNYDLSQAAFQTNDPEILYKLQVAISASLPPNIIYNLTIYDVNQGDLLKENIGGDLYNLRASISNAENLGTTNDASTYTVASSNVTFNFTPEKIGQGNGGTLYILNCSDSNGWWITGYTAHTLAQDLSNLLSPFFVNTVMVQNTTQFAKILNGTSIQNETLRNAVVINTCGEAVPIPNDYCKAPYSADNYANYSYTLGRKVNIYNWTWASIVGYPFYYVTNTANFTNGQNTWGIYGMTQTGGGGSIAFLRGLDNQTYSASGTAVTDSATRTGVTLTQTAIEACNYYGIYPASTQTSTRALSSAILATYHLSIGVNVLNPVSNYYPGTIYTHGTTNITGSFLALGLTRTPDIRVTGLGLLSFYHPRVYASEYNATGTSRVAVLQLGLAGGN